MLRSQTTVSPERNDAGVLVVLVLLVASLALVGAATLNLYVGATMPNSYGRKELKLVRLLSGWGNAGNAIVHAFLIVYLIVADPEPLKIVPDSDNPTGPAMLAVINLTLGLRTLRRGGGPALPFGWNTFVAFAGCLIPIVWPLFFSEGLSTWPPILVFIWLAIWACESTAFFASAAWWALGEMKGE